MRFFTLFCLLVLGIFAEDKTTPLLLGGGSYIQTQPYKGADTKIVPSPVVFFDNHLFYVRWTRVGVYFLGDVKDDFSWAFSLSAEPQPLGYKAGESSSLAGMNRESSIQGGLGFDMQYKESFFNFVLFQDILNKSNSTISRAEIGQHLKIDKVDLYPSISLIYHADKFNEYYYGVSSSEATLQRSVYSPASSIDYSFQTYAKYSFSEKWSTLLNFRVDSLNKEESNSPVVSEKYMYSGLISLLYKVEI
jgi:outer membrane protein